MKILSDQMFRLKCRDFKHAIIIRDPGQDTPPEALHLETYLKLHFHDITSSDQMPNGIVPQKYHIELAINYAKVVGINDLAITCWAGISRSSAIAIAVALGLFNSWNVAERILNPDLHHPNRAILKILLEMFKGK